MPDITLRKADKSYDGQVKVVSGLNLEIGDGEFMCLLGPSGCGKTTTLRLIAGLEHLSGGELLVGERVMDSLDAGQYVAPEHRGMGLVFQSYALWPHLTIERNTDFGLRLRKVPAAEREQRVAHVMKSLGIYEYKDRYPSQLSGGQQQRVALARMLAINPSVLLLDEPLSNLDARLRLEMRSELKRIHAEFGTTIVFVTHDQWEAMTLATKIAVMHEGRLQQVGSPDNIYDRPENRFVAEFVGTPPINIIEMDAMSGGFLAGTMREFLRRQGLPTTGSVGIRPEAVTLMTQGQAVPAEWLGAAARVKAVLPTGGSWIIDLDVAGDSLLMTTSAPPGVVEGAEVQFQVEPAALHVFDGKGQRCLEAAALAQRYAS